MKVHMFIWNFLPAIQLYIIFPHFIRSLVAFDARLSSEDLFFGPAKLVLASFKVDDLGCRTIGQYLSDTRFPMQGEYDELIEDSIRMQELLSKCLSSHKNLFSIQKLANNPQLAEMILAGDGQHQLGPWGRHTWFPSHLRPHLVKAILDKIKEQPNLIIEDAWMVNYYSEYPTGLLLSLLHDLGVVASIEFITWKLEQIFKGIELEALTAGIQGTHVPPLLFQLANACKIFGHPECISFWNSPVLEKDFPFPGLPNMKIWALSRDHCMVPEVLIGIIESSLNSPFIITNLILDTLNVYSSCNQPDTANVIKILKTLDVERSIFAKIGSLYRELSKRNENSFREIYNDLCLKNGGWLDISVLPDHFRPAPKQRLKFIATSTHYTGRPPQLDSPIIDERISLQEKIFLIADYINRDTIYLDEYFDIPFSFFLGSVLLQRLPDLAGEVFRILTVGSELLFSKNATDQYCWIPAEKESDELLRTYYNSIKWLLVAGRQIPAPFFPTKAALMDGGPTDRSAIILANSLCVNKLADALQIIVIFYNVFESVLTQITPSALHELLTE